MDYVIFPHFLTNRMIKPFSLYSVLDCEKVSIRPGGKANIESFFQKNILTPATLTLT